MHPLFDSSETGVDANDLADILLFESVTVPLGDEQRIVLAGPIVFPFT